MVVINEKTNVSIKLLITLFSMVTSLSFWCGYFYVKTMKDNERMIERISILEKNQKELLEKTQTWAINQVRFEAKIEYLIQRSKGK